MTMKQAQATNSNKCADDVLEELLELYCKVIDRCPEDHVPTKEVLLNFVLLYIADKLDSIDTRLYHLCQEKPDHE